MILRVKNGSGSELGVTLRVKMAELKIEIEGKNE